MPVPLVAGALAGGRAALPWLLRTMGVAKQAQRPTAAAMKLMGGAAGTAAQGGSQIVPTALRTVPGIKWGNLLGTGMLGMMGHNLMSGEDTPEASEDDLRMAMLMQQLQGAGFQSGPQETMMDPRQSMVMRQDPNLQASQMNRSIENMSSYGELDFLDELMQENAQLIAQISQRTQAMSQMADPTAAGIRPF